MVFVMRILLGFCYYIQNPFKGFKSWCLFFEKVLLTAVKKYKVMFWFYLKSSFEWDSRRHDVLFYWNNNSYSWNLVLGGNISLLKFFFYDEHSVFNLHFSNQLLYSCKTQHDSISDSKTRYDFKSQEKMRFITIK